MPTTTSNIMGSSAAGHLPENVIVEILSQALRFPNGIQSDRWAYLKKLRVDKFLSIPSLAHVVPEALFKHNKLIIKEGRYPFELSHRKAYPDSPFCPLILAGPDNPVAHWVKDLELRISLFNCDGPISMKAAAYAHYFWLQKLANLELGFDQLETLKIAFVLGKSRSETPDRNSEISPGFHLLLSILEMRFGVMKFPCKELQLEVFQHTCSEACFLTPNSQCGNWQMLNQCLSANGATALGTH